MDIDYLRGRFEHAKALEADVVKVDIEQFADLLEWIDEEPKRMSRRMKWWKDRHNKKFDKMIHMLEDMKSEQWD